MSQRFYRSIIEKLTNREKLLVNVFITFSLGLLFLYISSIEIFKFYFGNNYDDWQSTYNFTTINIGSGLIVTALIFLLARIFLTDNEVLEGVNGNEEILNREIKTLTSNVNEIKNGIDKLEKSNSFYSSTDEITFFSHVDFEIKKSKKLVYSIGPGFPCNSPRNTELANNLIKSIKSFLKGNGRVFKHYQIKSFVNIKWLRILKAAITASRSDKFKLYRENNNSSTLPNNNPIWIFVTDPESINSKTILVFTKKSNLSANYEFQVGYIFNTGTVFNPENNFYSTYFSQATSYGTTSIENDIKEIENHCKEVANNSTPGFSNMPDLDPINLSNLLTTPLAKSNMSIFRDIIIGLAYRKYNYYFSYGTYMDQSKLKELDIKVSYIKTTYIKGYKITLNGKDTKRKIGGGGRVLSIIKGTDHDRVWGLLYIIPTDNENFTDFEAKMNENGFTRNEIHKNYIQKEQQTYYTFEPKRSRKTDKLNPDYRNEIENLLAQLELPTSYIKEVQDLFTDHN